MIIKTVAIILLLCLVPVILNFTVFEYSSGFTNGKLGDWFAFYASYSGGIVGGLVAFLVAKLQIESNRKDERTKHLAQELPGYIMLKIEMKKWKKVLTVINEQKIKLISEIGKEEFEKALQKDFLNINVNFQSEKWEKKWLIQDPILLEELILFEEMFKHSYEYLRKDFSSFRNQYKKNIKYVGNVIDIPEDARQILKLELRVKQEAFYELEYMIEKIKKLETVLFKHIDLIHNFIEQPQKYNLESIRSTKEEFKVERNDGVVEPMYIHK